MRQRSNTGSYTQVFLHHLLWSVRSDLLQVPGHVTYLALLCLHPIKTSLREEPQAVSHARGLPGGKSRGSTPAPPCDPCPWASMSPSLTSVFPGEGVPAQLLALRSGAPRAATSEPTTRLWKCSLEDGIWRGGCYFGAVSNLGRTHSDKVLYLPGQEDPEGRLLGRTSAAVRPRAAPGHRDRHLVLMAPRGKRLETLKALRAKRT